MLVYNIIIDIGKINNISILRSIYSEILNKLPKTWFWSACLSQNQRLNKMTITNIAFEVPMNVCSIWLVFTFKILLVFVNYAEELVFILSVSCRYITQVP